MKIHVLDLNSLAPELGYPGCKIEEKAVVDARLGIVYLQIDEHHPDLRPHRPDYYSVHHQYGTHSAPYLFVEACCILCLQPIHLLAVSMLERSEWNA